MIRVFWEKSICYSQLSYMHVVDYSRIAELHENFQIQFYPHELECITSSLASDNYVPNKTSPPSSIHHVLASPIPLSNLCPSFRSTFSAHGISLFTSTLHTYLTYLSLHSPPF